MRMKLKIILNDKDMYVSRNEEKPWKIEGKLKNLHIGIAIVNYGT